MLKFYYLMALTTFTGPPILSTLSLRPRKTASATPAPASSDDATAYTTTVLQYDDRRATKAASTEEHG